MSYFHEESGLTPRAPHVGPNLLKPRRHDTALYSFIAQFTSPLVLIPIFAAVV